MKHHLSKIAVFIVLTTAIFSASTAFAASGSLSIVDRELTLLDDTDLNGIANIGDVIKVEVTINNSDGGCVAAGTTVMADLTKYGRSATESLTCVTDNGGVADVFETPTNPIDPLYPYILNAGLSGAGVDVDGGTGSQVEVFAQDPDDIRNQFTNNLVEPVDTIAPFIDSVGTISIPLDTGVLTVAGINDTLQLNGALVTIPDGDIINIDVSALTGNPADATLANGSPSNPIIAGITDNAGEFFTLTFTDNAGNTVTSGSGGVSVDNIAPTITGEGVFIISTDNGTAGIAGLNDGTTDQDKVSLTGVAYTDGDIATVSIDLTDLTGDPFLLGDGTESVVIPGTLDDAAKTFTISVSDDAGNISTTPSDPMSVDNELPSFPGVNAVLALKQDGSLPVGNTNIWYYYAANHVRTRVATTSGDVVSAKFCTLSLETNTTGALCLDADFNNLIPPVYYETAAGLGPYDFDFDLGTLGTFPTLQAGYTSNYQLIDDAGNQWSSANAPEFFTGVFNVNPALDDVLLNNPTSTDFSDPLDVDDFTAITNLTFHAENIGGPLGTLTMPGPVNLTDLATINALQNFATNVTVSGDEMRIDSSALAALDMPATLVMYQPTNVQPGLVMRNNLGVITGYVPNDASGGVYGDASGITWDGLAQTLTYDVSGFSEYDTDITAPTSAFVPVTGSSNIATNTNIVVTFSEAMDPAAFTYTVAPSPGGLAVVWSAGNTIATISHTAFANSVSYTFTITAAKDAVGNNMSGANTTTFTTVSAGDGGGNGGGSAGGSRSGSNLTGTNSPTSQTTSTTGGTTTFTDITGHWGETYIEQMQDAGFIEGYEDKTFKPDATLTRAEAAKMLGTWASASIAECTANPFIDVSCADWYGKYVNYVKAQSLIEGYSDGTFKPGNEITRAEALKLLLAAKVLLSTNITDVTNPFSDVTLTDWFYNHVMIGYKLNIIQGYGDGTFKPNNYVTRAEFAKMFVETLL